MEEEVKLLGTWASPFSHRVKLSLHLKQIQYQYIEQDLINKSTLLLNSNPIHKKIPVLIHNQKPISESLVILEYIDQIWPNHPFLPNEPHARATARFWAKFVDEKILQMALKGSAASGEEKEHIKEEIEEYLKLLEKELKGNEYFGGENVGFVDIVAFSIFYFFKIRQQIMRMELINEEKFPNLHKWMGKMCERDAVSESLPPLQAPSANIVAP